MRTVKTLIAALLLGTGVHAEGEKAGAFDYYVLALSWSANWCEIEGDAKNSPQCAPDQGHGWIMHGLWPQYHRGWPSHCRTVHRNPPRSLTNEMADIMGTSGLAWYQWKKHGRCSGLSAETYFATARRAYDSVNRPEVLRRLDSSVKLPASVIEQAFPQGKPTARSGHAHHHLQKRLYSGSPHMPFKRPFTRAVRSGRDKGLHAQGRPF